MSVASPTDRSPSPTDKRSSFSSIREKDSALAQSFTQSNISSYDQPLENEQAIVDETTTSPKSAAAQSATMLATQHFNPPRTQPFSRLHGTWYPVNSYKGWKQINVKGKLASRSFGDLQALSPSQEWDSNPLAWAGAQVLKGKTVGNSALETMPQEVFDIVLSHLVIDVPPNGLERRNVDLISMLLTSKQLMERALTTVYKNVTIPHSRIFSKFLAQVSANAELGKLVRRLDFSHFNPSSLFSTASERAKARNLTAESLLQCISLTPNLHEFLVQEYIDDDLSIDVLRTLMVDLRSMLAIDFCGCTSLAFRNSFAAFVETPLPDTIGIKRLSFHKCVNLAPSVFKVLLPRLTKLTHLDVAGTRITDEALASIPPQAKITHLNLARCNSLTAKNVFAFLVNHPAVQNLQFLSLGMDSRTNQLGDADDLLELVPFLPTTLKSLSLKGSDLDKDQLLKLLPLTKHLEELALGGNLKLRDVQRLLMPDPEAEVDEQLEWIPHSLKYLDLSDIRGNTLSLTELFSESILLKKMSLPLEVVEISEDIAKKIKSSPTALQRAGWRMSEVHARSWLVRQKDPKEVHDDGWRKWKMGASFWGMRKIPVAEAEVGGMYGSFMFGRKL